MDLGILNAMSMIIEKGYFDHILVSDRALAKISGFTYLTLGGHEGLGFPGPSVAKVYDLIHLSCYSDNRGWLFDDPIKPKGQLFGLKVATNGWGEFRARNLYNSRIMLNVHQDKWPFIEPLRFILATMYGLPIVSEHCTDPYPYNWWYGTFGDWRQAYDVINRVLVGYGSVAKEVLEFRTYMANTMSFRNCVEGVLK